jgi:hypothetical protein
MKPSIDEDQDSKQLINFTNDISLLLNKEIAKYNTFENDNKSFIKKLSNNDQILNDKSTNLDRHNALNLNNHSESSIPSKAKLSIFQWLIDIKLLKENSISFSDLPNLCKNGIFLCDLINHFEIVKLKLKKET